MAKRKPMVKFSVSPEHGRLAMKADKITAYAVYCILRDTVSKKNHSSHFTKNDVISLLTQLDFSGRKWTRIFASGEGVFWNCENKRLYMRSYKKVTKNLERLTGDKINYSHLYHKQVLIDLDGDYSATKIASQFYLAWFLARGEVTISRATLNDLFGLSPDRQRNLEKMLDGILLIKNNYAHIDREKYAKDPEALPEHHYTFGYERFQGDKVSSHEAIQYQLPNTFIVSPGNGESPTMTGATNSLKKAIQARRWHTDSYRSVKCLFAHTWRDFERSKNSPQFVRAYAQGVKKLWLNRQYL